MRASLLLLAAAAGALSWAPAACAQDSALDVPLPLEVFDYDRAAPLDVLLGPAGTRDGVETRAVSFATVSRTGLPILRTVDSVVVDGFLAFHGAPAGEKMEGMGQPVVVTTDETIASIPSYFVDPMRACPATTYYISAQAHGILEEVTDVETKARVLQALMEKYQPEGGYEPLLSPIYRKEIRGLLVARISLENVDAKVKLGQNRKPEERAKILEGLWKRGAPGDARAIATIMRRWPELRPPFPSGMVCDVVDLDPVMKLLEHAYWLDTVPRDKVRLALENATARVAAYDEDGELLAFARALCDGRVAWIYDVIVRPDRRSTGIGGELMKLLLDHPAVRHARDVRLGTKDAMPFYRRLGFETLAESPRHPWTSTEMVLRR